MLGQARYNIDDILQVKNDDLRQDLCVLKSGFPVIKWIKMHDFGRFFQQGNFSNRTNVEIFAAANILCVKNRYFRPKIEQWDYWALSTR